MRKSVVLTVVIGIMLVILALAFAALHLMTQESRIVEHKIRRTKAFFASQAGMVDALDRLRKGTVVLPTIGSPTTYPLSETLNGLPNPPQITIVARGDAPNNCLNTAPSDYCIFIRTDY